MRVIRNDIDIVNYVLAAAECIIRNGYVSSSFDNSTASNALYMYDNKEDVVISKEAYELATNSLKWIKDSTDTSEYVLKAKSILKDSVASKKDIGVLASVPYSYIKHEDYIVRKQVKEIENSKLAKRSLFQGNIGDKITVDVYEIKDIAHYNGSFGDVIVYQILDFDKNVYIWKTNTVVDTDKVKKLVGTIKDHKEFNGIKQTIVTRCKLS